MSKTKTLKAEDAFETLVVTFTEEVEGEGSKTRKYRSRPLTRSKRKQFREAQQALADLHEASEEDADDLEPDEREELYEERELEAIRLSGQLISVCVDPIDGAPEDVAEFIEEQWKSDRLSDAYIERMVLELGRAVSPFSGIEN